MAAPGPRGAADCLSLAAAPTFAVMALLTAVLGGGPLAMLCSAAPEASPLTGMVPDVPAHERLPRGAVAEADLEPDTALRDDGFANFICLPRHTGEVAPQGAEGKATVELFAHFRSAFDLKFSAILEDRL